MNGPLKRLSVLLVEDDPDYSALVQQWLYAAGHVPDSC
jgi:DNA-binding response OmpR family regulator